MSKKKPTIRNGTEALEVALKIYVSAERRRAPELAELLVVEMERAGYVITSARAAIQAMKGNCTDAMIEAGKEAIENRWSVDEVFDAMIDAALKEEQK